MTNEERQQAIEWLKRRPVMMAGAKRMYNLAVEALEAYVPDTNDGKPEVSCENDTEITRCSDDTISRQAALDAIHCDITVTGRQNAELVAATIGAFADRIKALPPVQPDEKLEKCRFEYIHACRIVTYPTPDTTKKDISDAYAVIKALQPIFGDVPFAKVKRGDSE